MKTIKEQIEKGMKGLKIGHTLIIDIAQSRIFNTCELLVLALRDLDAEVSFDESATVGVVGGFRIVNCPIWTGKNRISLKRVY